MYAILAICLIKQKKVLAYYTATILLLNKLEVFKHIFSENHADNICCSSPSLLIVTIHSRIFSIQDMLLFLTVLFVIFIKVARGVDQIRTADYNVFKSKAFVPDASSSLLETRQLLLSNVADCVLICLSSSKCYTAVSNAQTRTCMMYSEVLQTSGYLSATSSNDITTVSMRNAPGNITQFLAIV
jgi:hypothetical protein